LRDRGPSSWDNVLYSYCQNAESQLAEPERITDRFENVSSGNFRHLDHYDVNLIMGFLCGGVAQPVRAWDS